MVVDPKRRNPTGKGGFVDHPENRNSGTWNSKDSISFQYNKFLRMTDEELAEALEQKGSFTQAQKIAYKRIKDAENDLKTTQEITDRTEGKAPQKIDLTTNNESLNPLGELTADELRKLAKG